MMRSARSISPPLASRPSDSALARLVRDHRAQRHDGERQHRHVRRIVGREVPRHAAEQHRVGDTIDDGVEVRAALTRRVRCLGQSTVEQVGQGGKDDQHQAQTQLAEADRDRRTDRDERDR